MAVYWLVRNPKAAGFVKGKITWGLEGAEARTEIFDGFEDTLVDSKFR